MDEEGCTSLDALASECYKESVSRDERSACVLELGGTAAADAAACDHARCFCGAKASVRLRQHWA